MYTKSGYLEPRSTQTIEISITSERSLIYKDLIIACDIQNSHQPALIEILGEVKDLDVTVWSSQTDETKLKIHTGTVLTILLNKFSIGRK